MDTMVNTTLSGRIIANGNIYEKLLTLDGEGQVREELASSYALSDSGRRLSFTIREGVRFHDGSVMTVDDVVASMNRWLKVYANASSAAKGAVFQKTSDRTLEIQSESSLALLVYMIAEAPQSAIIMPRRLAEETTPLVSETIGTGPYRLEKWNSGELMELTAFEEYQAYGDGKSGKWGRKEAKIKTLRYYFVSDQVTRLLGLESGQYDFINDVMADDRNRIQNNAKLTLLDGDESGLIALVFNKKQGPMVNKTMRQAVSYAFDAKELMRSCYGDYGYAIHSDYMEKEQLFWKTEGKNPYETYETEKAKKLLEAAGYQGETIRILTSNLSNLDRIAEAASQMLSAIGVKNEVLVCDWASMTEKRKDAEGWDLFISAFSQVTLPTMKSFLNPTYPGWISEESQGYQALSGLLEAEDMEKAAKLWEDAQTILYEEVPAYIPGHYSTSYAKKESLKGVILQNGFFFWNAEL